jgi:hypothetical protein
MAGQLAHRNPHWFVDGQPALGPGGQAQYPVPRVVHGQMQEIPVGLLSSRPGVVVQSGSDHRSGGGWCGRNGWLPGRRSHRDRDASRAPGSAANCRFRRGKGRRRNPGRAARYLVGPRTADGGSAGQIVLAVGETSGVRGDVAEYQVEQSISPAPEAFHQSRQRSVSSCRSRPCRAGRAETSIPARVSTTSRYSHRSSRTVVSMTPVC